MNDYIDRQRLTKCHPVLALIGTSVLLYSVAGDGLADAGPLPNPVPGSCSSKISGSSSNSLMKSNNGSFECAYEAQHNDVSIGAWDTQSWTSNSAGGYWNLTNCDGQTGGVTITDASAYTDFGGSITWTAFNGTTGGRHWGAAIIWQTEENGGVAGSQFTAGCGGSAGTTAANFYYISTSTISTPASTVTLGATSTLTIQVDSPYGLGSPTGTVYFFQQAGTTPDTSTDWILGTGSLASNGSDTSGLEISTNFAGKNQSGQTHSPVPGTAYIYAVYQGDDFASDPTSINQGWLGTQTASIAVDLVTSSTATATPASSASVDNGSAINSGQTTTKRLPNLNQNGANTWLPSSAEQRPSIINTNAADLRQALEVFCPKESAPVQISLDSETMGLDRYMSIIKRKGYTGIRIKAPKALQASAVNTQLLCQRLDQPVIMNGRLGFGTPEGDIIETQSGSTPSTLFGGLGNDLLSARHPKDVAFGGPGHDFIVLTGLESVGAGGLGNDRIEDRGEGPSTLIGGPGRDRLVGGVGATQINALDGKGGDRIHCNSPENRVLADKGDIITGPCTVVEQSLPQ